MICYQMMSTAVADAGMLLEMLFELLTAVLVPPDDHFVADARDLEPTFENAAAFIYLVRTA